MYDHPITLSWFKAYLTNRSQTTLLNNIRSSSQPILTGVPQGSILGPLLFILYVNNLPNSTSFSRTLMYADDWCYKGTILPLLDYANVTYSLIASHLKKKLQRLQNRAMRIIYQHLPNTDMTTLHTMAKAGTLAQRASRQLLCLMFRRAHHSDLFPIVDTSGVTRSSNKIKFVLPRPKYERFKSYPLYFGTTLWDKLDANVQKSLDYEIFKIRIPKKPDLVNYPIDLF